MTLIVLTTFALISCQKEDDTEIPTSVGNGLVQFSLNSLTIVQDNSNSRIAAVSTDLWRLVIISDATRDTMAIYDDFIDVPSEVPLIAGDYTVSVYSDNYSPAGFGDTYATFSGHEAFSIQDSQTTSVTIQASPSNFRVKVAYSEETQADFKAVEITLSTPNIGGSLVYNFIQSEFGYFALDDYLNIQGFLFFTGPEGITDSRVVTGTIASPQAGESYTVTINSSLLNGDAGFTIEVDESYVDKTLELGGLEDPNSNFVPGGIYYNPQTGTPYQTVIIPYGTGANDYEVWMAEDYSDDALAGYFDTNASGVFYNQEAAIASTPEGCRLPTKEDFQALNSYYASTEIISFLSGGDSGLNLNLDGRVGFDANGAIYTWSYNNKWAYYMTSSSSSEIPIQAYLSTSSSNFGFESSNVIYGGKVRYIIDL